MVYPCTGVILAGGLNRRFSGREKALIRFGENRIIERIYSVMQRIFNETILVTNAPLHYLDLDLNALMITDVRPVRSALTGIHTGLFYASQDYAFICAADIPFLKQGVIEVLVNAIDSQWDVIIPETEAGLEPLCAVYAKQMLGTIENNLNQKRFRIQQSFRRGRVKTITTATLRRQDPELISFFNINTPQDLEKAIRMDEKERIHSPGKD